MDEPAYNRVVRMRPLGFGVRFSSCRSGGVHGNKHVFRLGKTLEKISPVVFEVLDSVGLYEEISTDSG